MPVPIKLEPRESVNSERNTCLSLHTTKTHFRSGCSSSPAPRWWRDPWCGSRRYAHSRLTSFILTYAVGLGKSDPYVVFTLDNHRVFKSQTKKKTVDPQWNETFAVSVVSVTSEYWEPPFSDYDHFSLLVSRRISNLRSLTGTRSKMPKAWELPGSTSEKLSPSVVWRRPSL